MAGGVGVAGHGPALGAGRFEAEVERPGLRRPGQQLGVAGGRVGDGGGAGPGGSRQVSSFSLDTSKPRIVLVELIWLMVG